MVIMESVISFSIFIMIQNFCCLQVLYFIIDCRFFVLFGVKNEVNYYRDIREIKDYSYRKCDKIVCKISLNIY